MADGEGGEGGVGCLSATVRILAPGHLDTHFLTDGGERKKRGKGGIRGRGTERLNGYNDCVSA